MSSLLSRLTALHEAGHARRDIQLYSDPRTPAEVSYRGAAVLAAITDRPRPGMLLIHRPSNMRAHPGQVALPGGKIDPGETPVAAALRETDEELGIAPDQVRVVGESDRYRTGSGFDITPVVGMVPPDLEIRPNPLEVAQWFEVPLDFALDPANHHQEKADFNGRSYTYWQITWGEHRIWGVTAGIIVNLSRRLAWHG